MTGHQICAQPPWRGCSNYRKTKSSMLQQQTHPWWTGTPAALDYSNYGKELSGTELFKMEIEMDDARQWGNWCTIFKRIPWWLRDIWKISAPTVHLFSLTSNHNPSLGHTRKSRKSFWIREPPGISFQLYRSLQI